VVKILSDRMELDTLTSRITLGILVLQDLWAIAFLAVQPNLNDLKVSALASSAGRAVLLVAAAAIAARFILPTIFRRASRMPELVLVMAMAWCFASCGLANALGLSPEMGALVAGVCIASFPYHTDIAAKVSALRDFFITLFFVALGLRIPMPTANVLFMTGTVVVFILASRLLTVFPVLYLLRYGNRASLVPAINLSQISEFSLVLAALGVQLKHISPDMMAAFILALVVTALLSSILIPSTHTIYRLVNPLLEKIRFRDTVAQTQVMDKSGGEHGGDHPQIVLLGFYREASSLLQEILTRHPADTARKILVVDFNPEAHRKLTEIGIHCKYGDLSHPDTLRHLELCQARVLVCTIPDHILKGTSNMKLLKALRAMAPDAQIVLTAETLESAKEMYAEGADYVFVPRLLSATYLADLIDHIHAGTDGSFKTTSREKLTQWSEVLA